MGAVGRHAADSWELTRPAPQGWRWTVSLRTCRLPPHSIDRGFQAGMVFGPVGQREIKVVCWFEKG